MGTVLMCKNTEVFKIEEERVCCGELLPGLMSTNPCKLTFLAWLTLRYSSNSNASARKLKGILFGQGNRTAMNRATHAFSLSDCYWLKDEAEKLLFEQVSPYYAAFWKGEGAYQGEAIPTLYVSGFLNKEWVSSDRLNKYGNETRIEKECRDLCVRCDAGIIVYLMICILIFDSFLFNWTDCTSYYFCIIYIYFTGNYNVIMDKNRT